MLANVYFLKTNHLQSQIKAASWLPHLQDTALWFPDRLLSLWNLAAASRNDVWKLDERDINEIYCRARFYLNCAPA